MTTRSEEAAQWWGPLSPVSALPATSHLPSSRNVGGELSPAAPARTTAGGRKKSQAIGLGIGRSTHAPRPALPGADARTTSEAGAGWQQTHTSKADGVPLYPGSPWTACPPLR